LHIHVFFFQTGTGAVVTGSSTGVTKVNAVL